MGSLDEESGRGAHFFLYMHSATSNISHFLQHFQVSHTMTIKDVEGIYYHDGDLVKAILEPMYLFYKSPYLCKIPKDKARHGKVSAEQVRPWQTARCEFWKERSTAALPRLQLSVFQILISNMYYWHSLLHCICLRYASNS